MENLDFCILWFYYGLYLGYNLRKIVGENGFVG